MHVPVARERGPPISPVCPHAEPIPEASDMKEAMEMMPETLEYGVLNANVLGLLKDTLSLVTGQGHCGRQGRRAGTEQPGWGPGF